MCRLTLREASGIPVPSLGPQFPHLHSGRAGQRSQGLPKLSGPSRRAGQAQRVSSHSQAARPRGGRRAPPSPQGAARRHPEVMAGFPDLPRPSPGEFVLWLWPPRCLSTETDTRGSCAFPPPGDSLAASRWLWPLPSLPRGPACASPPPPRESVQSRNRRRALETLVSSLNFHELETSFRNMIHIQHGEINTDVDCRSSKTWLV